MQKMISQGAEAKIILSDKFVIKDRISKSYRIPELDKKIRKKRTKAETKLLLKASEIINCPIPKISKDKNLTKIKMPFVKGEKLSENLDNFSLEQQKHILRQIGKDIAKLHSHNIIHGDLTTSNMILKNCFALTNKRANNVSESNQENGLENVKQKFEIFLIDFGLGYFNGKYEDKAVDIHLLKQALEAKHFRHWKILFNEFLKEYKIKNKDSEKILNQLIKVEKRGRYKH